MRAQRALPAAVPDRMSRGRDVVSRPRALAGAVRARVSGDRRDRGLSTIEVVILAPVMILFILVLVAFGQLVNGRGALDGAARDAARAGSIQKDHATAIAEARKAAEADLGDVCSGPVSVTQTSTGFEPDTLFTVEVSCEVRGLAMIGLDVPTTLQASFSSPLDPFRRTA
ncbi:TadE/TadG family type IV pilus assembly protein [Streptomyces sp. NPDC005281]|uniref:TadE/TadG family type IV pilus assembly protein n=1 Tax=Streptomyces sp. NPDC005281 TaxID=3155712 RepID=UPI0033A5C9D0